MLTRDELIASFKPCPICGKVVETEIRPGIYEPKHDYGKHGLVKYND